MLGCLVKVSPLDVDTGTRVDMYLSSFGKREDAAANGLDSRLWEPCITRRPATNISLWNGDFLSAVQPGRASLPINLEIAKNTYPNAGEYYWSEAPIEIYYAESSAAWPWPSIFKGRVKSYGGAYPAMTLQCEVGDEEFSANILPATYAGTGGLEGEANIANQVKPLILGWAQNVEPTLIDGIENVYQFSAYGAIEAVTKLYERGSEFPASIGDYATLAALIAAPITEGNWGTCLASGLVRLGAPQFGVITGDVKGHRVGATTPILTGAVVQALVTIAGIDPAKIHTASLGLLDAAVPYRIGIVITDQETFLDVAKRLVVAANWQCGISLVGQFFAAKVDLTPAAALTLHAQGKAAPPVIDTDQLEVSTPYHRTILGAARSWRVHSPDEIAWDAPIVYTGRYDDTRNYVPGNVVNLSDLSEWIYIGDPDSGNPPPTWPTTSNAWWENITPPTDIAAPQVAIRTARIHSPRDAANVARYMLGATTNGSNVATITVARHNWDYPNGTPSLQREPGTITGLVGNTDYWVYFDDATLANPTPTYVATTTQLTAENSAANPYRHPLGRIKTPAIGGAATTGGAAPGIGYQVIGYETGAVITNFNARNDRNATAIPAPTFAVDGTAVDHTLGANASIDLSLDCLWSGNNQDSDGWEVSLYGAGVSTPYTPGSNPAAEERMQGPPVLRAFWLRGLNPTLWYTWGLRNFRDVDPDVWDIWAAANPSLAATTSRGRIVSAWAKPTLGSENPYRPETSAIFNGDIQGTVAGTAAGTVASGALAANAGLNADGTVKNNKVILGSVLDQALIAAGFSVGAAAIVINPSELFRRNVILGFVKIGERVVIDCDLTWQLYKANPALRENLTYQIRGFVYRPATAQYFYSPWSTEGWQWQGPAAVGTFNSEQRRSSFQWTIDFATTSNNMEIGYEIQAPAGNGMVVGYYQYMKANDLRQTE